MASVYEEDGVFQQQDTLQRFSTSFPSLILTYNMLRQRVEQIVTILQCFPGPLWFQHYPIFPT